jgi:hypothetical protein
LVEIIGTSGYRVNAAQMRQGAHMLMISLTPAGTVAHMGSMEHGLPRSAVDGCCGIITGIISG